MRCLPVSSRRLVLSTAAGLFVVSALFPALGSATAQSKKKGAPEIFHARATTSTADAVGDVRLTIQVDQYTPERDIQAMEQALKTGGSEGFLQALRQAPIAGRIQVGTQTFTIRWARQQPTASGSVISLVTDAPVFFVGGGVPGAKPRTGFDVAVVQLTMDSSGLGRGTMAPAARVKPGGQTGVEVDDYAEQPVKLVSVSKVIS